MWLRRTSTYFLCRSFCVDSAHHAVVGYGRAFRASTVRIAPRTTTTSPEITGTQRATLWSRGSRHRPQSMSDERRNSTMPEDTPMRTNAMPRPKATISSRPYRILLRATALSRRSSADPLGTNPPTMPRTATSLPRRSGVWSWWWSCAPCRDLCGCAAAGGVAVLMRLGASSTLRKTP